MSYFQPINFRATNTDTDTNIDTDTMSNTDTKTTLADPGPDTQSAFR